MAYFDNPESVQEYIEMTKNYVGEQTLSATKRHVPKGSSILELGMGPGHDLNILKRDFTVTGSDASQIFLDIHRQNHPDNQLYRLNATTIDIEQTFDCIYSNKVLHQLDNDDLSKSFKRQHHLLPSGGFVVHSFWHGTGEEMHQGQRYWLRDEAELSACTAGLFEVVEMTLYKEFEPDDSLCVVLKRL